MTAEEKAAAVKAAMAKRGQIQKVTTNERAGLANQVKAEKEKRGAKKAKVYGATPSH